MKNKILPFSVIIIFGVIFFIFYKGLEDSKIYTPDVNSKKVIPVFNTKEFFSGENVESSSIFELDKVHLLNIWSSWCVPCRNEHTLLMSLKESKKIKVVGINFKDKKINAEKFLFELGNPYEKIIFDQEGIIAIEWGAYGVPESFLIKDGIIIKRYIGPLDKKLTKEIEYIIK